MALTNTAPRLRVRASAKARPRQTGRQEWAPPALALLALTICAAGGGNNALSGVIAAMAEVALAAVIFAQVTVPPRALRLALPVLLPLAGLLVWSAIPHSSLAPDLWPLALARLGGATALFLAAAALGLRHGHSRTLGLWFTHGAALLIVATMLLRVIDLPPEWQITSQDVVLHRFSGTIGNPNAAGTLFAMLGTVASGLTLERARMWYDLPGQRRLLRVLESALVALGCLAMVGLTQSRGGLLLWAGAQAVLLATCGGRWRWTALATLALLMAGLAGATLDRLEVVTQDGAGRVMVWQTYADAVRHAPWTGYGLGTFIAVNQHGLTPQTAPALWNFGAAHAAPLQVLLETGWIGLALVAWLLGALLWRIAPVLWRSEQSVGMAMALAAGIALLASLADIALNVPGIVAVTACLLGGVWGRALRGL